MLERLSLFLTLALALVLPISLTLSWILLGLLFALLLFSKGPRTCLLELKQAPFIKPVLLFSLVSLISGLLAGGPGECLASFSTVRGFAIYPVAFLAFHLSGHKQGALKTFLLVTAISGLLGACQQLFNVGRFTKYPYLQATGFLSSPMSYAGVMQIGAFLSLALAFRHPVIFGGRALSWAICLFNFLGLLFAAERSAWLGMTVAIFAFTMRISKKAFLAGLFTVLCGAILAFQFVPVVKTRLSALSNWRQDVSVTARLTVWDVAVKTFQKKPLSGVGPRNFPRIELNEAVVKGQSEDLNHGHSNIMHLVATTGLLGLSAYLFLVLIPLLGLYRSAAIGASEGELESALALGLYAALISLFAAGLFEYNFGSGVVRLNQWFCLAFYKGAAKKD